ncbi:MAG: tRNA (N6-isopentenyl adenosine(37)-C2)-methylthiotransferase MiaB [Hungatella sp.]|jgi:tRNA-2-methylthio-N6-dimethylallyladenosine synthase|nr:tRNA (N6-isopentenyl adenosine(37)-C2)-methylthiotransferase MiaB [Hungatella sp.]
MHNEIDLDKIDINLKPPTEEPFRQYYFMARCREWVREFERKNGRRPTAFTQTFGCQMNAKDSEKLQGILERIGFVEADDEKADFVLYNTCTVRENANQRVYGRLGFLNTLKRKNPNMLIALCGCMMQEPDVVDKIKKSYGFVDIIFGTHNIFKLAELLFDRLEKKKMVVDIWKDTRQIVEELPAERKFSFKSGVNIMFGCDNFCSYCIVPYVRGRERSRKPEDIIAEVEKLAADGVTEVMLLGQNVNSYGKNLETPITFARLLRQVEEVEGIERIRFMTSHPKDLSQELIQVMGESKKICRHLHLPIQSGSTRILKAMNRRYTKEQYLDLVDRIRAAVPDISLTTDIIVGFPGETEEDFLETMDVVEKVGFDSAFTFIYSRRTGTPAASMEDQVRDEVVKDRFDRLLARVQEIAARVCARDLHTTQKVLVESLDDHLDGYVTGRLDNNIVVHFPGDASLVGTMVPVYLKESKGFYYMGTAAGK